MIKNSKYNLTESKSLIFYGALIAGMISPGMQETLISNDKFNIAENSSTASDMRTENKFREIPIYPYAKMMNLFEQCRQVESESHRKITNFTQRKCEPKELTIISQKAEALSRKLKKEKDGYSNYLIDSNFNKNFIIDESQEKIRRKGRKVSLSHNVARRRCKQEKTTLQALNEYIDKMDSSTQKLQALVETNSGQNLIRNL